MLVHVLSSLVLALHTGECYRGSRPPSPYYGKLIGALQTYAHGVSGQVFAVDEATLFVKSFTYDGTGPDAHFWIGNTPRPSPEGIPVPYPEDYYGQDRPVLKAYNKTDLILKLPQGFKVNNIKWLSVWCRRFTVNFGELLFPKDLDPPKTRVLPEFKRLAHGLRSGNITILDAKTFYIPNLHYDGAGPDAYFWVGNGSEPSRDGVKVNNERNSSDPLRGYEGEDIEIQLPGDLTVYDIDWLAVWCVQYRHNFGHVMIPKDLDVPPALGQTVITTSSKPPKEDADLVTNCVEMLNGRVQVQWVILGEWVQITLSARMREEQYVAFGPSGEEGRPAMVGADVVVAFYNAETKKFKAIDYYMSATSQCDGKNGVCPDEKIGGRNNVVLLSGERRSGVTTISYRRPLVTNEPINDRPIPSNGEVSVIAAIGPLNSRQEPNAHAFNDKTDEDVRIAFGSKSSSGCPNNLYTSFYEEETIKPWPQNTIIGETTFHVRIGPTGGKRGYTALTGNPSWGIAFYMNDLLIPEIYVEREQTYTFIVEAGRNDENPARFHPLYITDSPVGGFGQQTRETQRRERVYAGVAYDGGGYPYPTAAGRYCEWEHQTIDKNLEMETFEEYMKTLNLMCEEGEPSFLNWTVPKEAPDLLYYQCYAHLNLGWKIRVVDPGSLPKKSSASTLTATILLIITCLFVHLKGR